MQTLDRLRIALEKALKFIMKNRNADGLWSDFFTLAGESVCWVSGYVGYALACRGVMREASLEKMGLKILECQGEDGGWGYGPEVPPDADSTSWCLLFLSRLGTEEWEGRKKALGFLSAHQNIDGGFKTYARSDEIGHYMRLNEKFSFEGWCSSQACVTAVACQALMENNACKGVSEALSFIRASQSSAGYWEPYWWSDRLYATFNSMKALNAGKRRGDTKPLKRAQDWIVGTQLGDGGWSDFTPSKGVPFSTALALRGLMLEPRSELSSAIDKGLGWLLTNQLADGGWSSHHILRIPHPAMREPWKHSSWQRDGKAINALISDHNRLYSTATAFSALSEFAAMHLRRLDS